MEQAQCSANETLRQGWKDPIYAHQVLRLEWEEWKYI